MTQGETWEKLDKDSCNWTIEPQLLTLHLEKVNRVNPDITPQETPLDTFICRWRQPTSPGPT
jgi:hypothetical protein